MNFKTIMQVSISILTVVLLLCCKGQKSITQLSNPDQLDAYRADIVFDQPMKCSDVLAYIPDEHFFDKEVRINIQLMNSEDSLYGFDEEKGRWYMKFLIHNANKRLRNNKKMNLPEGNNTPALAPKYQYVITSVADDDGYFWNYDDELCYFINKGKNRNNYDKEVIDKYEIGGDSIVNIFVMPHHKDSLNSRTYKTHGTGIALGNSLKIAGLVEDKEKPWAYATLLNHEVGHVFGLRHSWAYNDGCDDTPKNPNCWQETKSRKGCEGPISNNLMDYNNSQMAISPCQLGIIHRSLTRKSSKNRKFVREAWCSRDASRIISISENVDWCGERDVTSDIHVMEGATLTVHCRLSIPPHGEIVIHPGGTLQVNESATIHNDCDKEWQGIRIMEDGKKKGKLIISQSAIIEDITPF